MSYGKVKSPVIQSALPDNSLENLPELRYRPTFAYDKTGEKPGQKGDSEGFFAVVVYPIVGIGILLYCRIPKYDYTNLRTSIPNGWPNIEGAVEYFFNFDKVEVWKGEIHLGSRIPKKRGNPLPRFVRLCPPAKCTEVGNGIGVDSNNTTPDRSSLIQGCLNL